MTLVRYNPYYGLNRLSRRFDHLFDGFDLDSKIEKSDFLPKVDISETEQQLILQAEVPGISKDDIKITVDKDNVLTFKGSKKREVKEDKDSDGINYHRIERSYGEFTRSFVLPDYVNPDSVDAKFVDGLLTIKIDKIEPKKAEEITVEIK